MSDEINAAEGSGGASADAGLTSGNTEATQAGAQGAPTPDGSGDPLNTPQSDAGLEDMRQKMVATHTRRTQSLADQERAVSQERARLQELMVQTQTNMSAAQGTAPAPSPWSEQIDPHIRENLSPEGAALFDRLGELTTRETQRSQETITALEQKVGNLEGAFTQTQSNQRARDYERQVVELRQKYGDELVNAHSHGIVPMLSANPNLTIEQAFNASAPAAVQDHFIRQATTNAQKKFQESTGASLFGMNPEPSAEPANSFKAGESMMESALGANDPQDIRSEIMRDAMEGMG